MKPFTKNHILLILGMILLLQSVSCKKGENDPFLSCRSRKTRVVGEWLLSSGTITTHSGTQIDSTLYNGSTYIEYLNGNIIQGVYTHRILFERKGSFTEEILSDNVLEKIDGYWMFGARNKDAGMKSKETIIVFIQSDALIANGITTITTYSGTNYRSYAMKLDELKNEEMTLIYDGSTNNQNSSDLKGSLSFKKK